MADELERIDDERLELVAITSVEVEPDLRHAVVCFDTLLGEATDDEALEALGEARVAIQAAIGRQARLKRTPTLTFKPDMGIRTGERVDEILREHPPVTRLATRSSATTKKPMPDGFSVVDKQAGWTSHDVVAHARKVLGERRVGHSGTLDPDATGVLLLGVGRATRLLRFLTALPKTYTGEVVLGRETSTLDASGQTTATHDMTADTGGSCRGRGDPDRADHAGAAHGVGAEGRRPASPRARSGGDRGGARAAARDRLPIRRRIDARSRSCTASRSSAPLAPTCGRSRPISATRSVAVRTSARSVARAIGSFARGRGSSGRRARAAARGGCAARSAVDVRRRRDWRRGCARQGARRATCWASRATGRGPCSTRQARCSRSTSPPTTPTR